MNIEQLLRASGRTSRTVNEVERMSKSTRVIFVVPYAMKREYDIKFKDNENVTIISDENSLIDWKTMTARGMRAYEVIFDHSVIYERFGVQIDKYLEACHIKQLLK